MSQQNVEAKGPHVEAKGPHASRTAKVSAFLSSVAVTISVFTAMSVYRAEHDRVTYDAVKFVQSLYAEYAKERESKPGLVGCMTVLQDTTALTDAQLKVLFTGPPRHNSTGEFQPMQTFTYDKGRHAGLSLCVDDEKVKQTLRRGNLVSVEDNDEIRDLVAAIDQKLGWGITMLDAQLIAYRA